jgi:hypothetical protein
MSKEQTLAGAPDETTVNECTEILGRHHDREFRRRLRHAPSRDSLHSTEGSV